MKVRPCALIIENNHVLLMQYLYSGQEVFALPGGNPDLGETLTQALVRELREELSIETEIQGLLLAGEVILPHQKQDVLHTVFAAKIIAGIPQINPSHTSALGVCWKPLQSLGELNMYPNVGENIQDMWLGYDSKVYIGRINQPFF